MNSRQIHSPIFGEYKTVIFPTILNNKIKKSKCLCQASDARLALRTARKYGSFQEGLAGTAEQRLVTVVRCQRHLPPTFKLGSRLVAKLLIVMSVEVVDKRSRPRSCCIIAICGIPRMANDSV